MKKLWASSCTCFVWWVSPSWGRSLSGWSKKDQSSYLDRQGRELLNFQLSFLLYGFLSFLLCFILIGIPLLIAVGVATVVLTIIGIVNASEGRIYRFPLTIRLL